MREIVFYSLQVFVYRYFIRFHTCAQPLNIWSISFSILVHKAALKAGLLPVIGMETLPGPLNLAFWLTEVGGSCDDKLSTSSAFFKLLRRFSLALSKTDSTVDCSIPKWWNTCKATPTWKFNLWSYQPNSQSKAIPTWLWFKVSNPLRSINFACFSTSILAWCIIFWSFSIISTPFRSTSLVNWSEKRINN